MDNLSNRSLGELFSELSGDISMLVRKEMELARVEMSRIASTLATRATYIAIGAVLCAAGLLSLIATLTLAGIAVGLSPLVSSAIVTLLVLAIGGVLVSMGISALRKDTLVPTETIQTLKETGEISRRTAGRRVPSRGRRLARSDGGADGSQSQEPERRTRGPHAVRQGSCVADAAERPTRARPECGSPILRRPKPRRRRPSGRGRRRRRVSGAAKSRRRARTSIPDGCGRRSVAIAEGVEGGRCAGRYAITRRDAPERRTHGPGVGRLQHRPRPGRADRAPADGANGWVRAPDTRADAAIRALGAREVAHGVSILARPAAAPAVWARVGGDIIDLYALGAAARWSGVNRGAATVSAAALLGATAMDLFVAGRLSALAGAPRRTAPCAQEESWRAPRR